MTPCEQPHKGEAYGSFKLTGDKYPGHAKIAEQARPRCAKLLPEYALDPDAVGDLQTYFYYPDRSSWPTGERTVTCWAGPSEGKRDASIRTDSTTLEPDQFIFLAATKPAYEADLTYPEGEPGDDLPASKAWAGRMAKAYRQTAASLKALPLPPKAAKELPALIEWYENAIPDWRAAAAAKDVDTFYGYVEEVVDNEAGDFDELNAKVRAALELPEAAGSGSSV
ncbi:septum formation family protein [Streptomyces sp. NBC_01304]|uniref:septum formation family protein n=1 Tax=Streptomyces sp. NBC_01304 TaxID=2903818 RepID=UPI002E109CDB|nr:septum formation family protein [Streptomyces sp. NBC_01304]